MFRAMTQFRNDYCFIAVKCQCADLRLAYHDHLSGVLGSRELRIVSALTRYTNVICVQNKRKMKVLAAFVHSQLKNLQAQHNFQQKSAGAAKFPNDSLQKKIWPLEPYVFRVD